MLEVPVSFGVPARDVDCSRRRPATQASASASVSRSGLTLRSPQQLVVSRSQWRSEQRAAHALDPDAVALLQPRQVSCVSGNSTPVSSVNTRTDGSTRMTMSRITDASFWNELATARRG